MVEEHGRVCPSPLSARFSFQAMKVAASVTGDQQGKPHPADLFSQETSFWGICHNSKTKD